MAHTSLPIYDAHGNPIRTHQEFRALPPDADGQRRVYDAEGFGAHNSCIPDEIYFPEPPEPDLDEQQDANRLLEAATLRLVIRLATAVVAAGHQACSTDQPIPPVLDQAIGELDVILRSLPETEDDEPEPILVEPHPEDPEYRPFREDEHAMFAGRVMAIG